MFSFVRYQFISCHSNLYSEGFYMEAGLAEMMRYSILNKLSKSGASSMKTAVTPEKAGLTASEQGWLIYLSGGMTSQIRKTKDSKYYVRPY